MEIESSSKQLLKELESLINESYYSGVDFPIEELNTDQSQLFDLIQEISSRKINTKIEIRTLEMNNIHKSELLEEVKEVNNINICMTFNNQKEGILPKCGHFICSKCLEENMLTASGDYTLKEETNFTIKCNICTYIYELEEIQKVYDWNWQLEKRNTQKDKRVFCPLDLVPILGNSGIILRCRHSFHKDCLQHYLISLNIDNISNIKCPCMDCHMNIDTQIIHKLCTNSQLNIPKPKSSIFQWILDKLNPYKFKAVSPRRVFKFEEGMGRGEVERLDHSDPMFIQASYHFLISQEQNTKLTTPVIWRIKKYAGDVAFMNKMKDSFMTLDVRYLYHGTSEEAINSIIHGTGGTGFRLPWVPGALGKGIYFASDPGKCLGFVKHGECLIIRTMVCLGEEKKDYNTIVFGKYREYCVYSQDQCQPCEIILFAQGED